MKKPELRRIFLKKRGELGLEERASSSQQITSRFLSLFDLSAISCLHIFLTIEEKFEVDMRPLIEAVWAGFSSVKTVVPVIDQSGGSIRSAVYKRDSVLKRGKWGIREPFRPEFIMDSEIDLVAVPLLAFDRRGGRVGYGGGYYDRFLANCRQDCQKIGVSFFEPVDQISGITASDVALDHCVTPERIWSFK